MRSPKIDAGAGIIATVAPFTLLKPYMAPKVYGFVKKLPRYRSWDELPFAQARDTNYLRGLACRGETKSEAMENLGVKFQALLEVVVPDRLGPALLCFEPPGNQGWVVSLYLMLTPEEADTFDLLTKEPE